MQESTCQLSALRKTKLSEKLTEQFLFVGAGVRRLRWIERLDCALGPRVCFALNHLSSLLPLRAIDAEGVF
jgi:hypothetical protein